RLVVLDACAAWQRRSSDADSLEERFMPEAADVPLAAKHSERPAAPSLAPGKSLDFAILARDSQSKARAGVVLTLHGAIPTPVFMPVGTHATVKAVAPDDLEAIGARIVLANTYHMLLRPGPELVARF